MVCSWTVILVVRLVQQWKNYQKIQNQDHQLQLKHTVSKYQRAHNVNIEEEAKRHTQAKQEEFYDKLVTLLIPAQRHIASSLYESRMKDRSLERLEDSILMARRAAEQTGLK